MNFTNENTSKCLSFSNTDFEVVNDTPVYSNYELNFLRCNACKAVVRVIDYHNVGTLVKKLAIKLKIDLYK